MGDERGVVEGAALAVLHDGLERLEGAAVDGDRVPAGAQWDPEDVDRVHATKCGA
jgi:hypothetical protein